MTNFRSRAQELDAEFPCLRDEFFIPTIASLSIDETNNAPSTYLCGNSLGLMPKATYTALATEMDAWKNMGVNGHFKRPDGSRGWVDQDELVIPGLAQICGAKESEVAFTGGLTNNLNSLLSTFYKPQGNRTKILFEAKAFPSDNYCFQNQVKMQGLDPEKTLVRVFPREGKEALEHEDILEAIEEQGDEIALVIFSGIQYYTGQLFKMKEITAAGHKKGCVVGWDLAHAVGNVELELHDWGVDFAVFCTYKYLNSGAGSVAGLFVHEKHHDDRPRPAGWFGVPCSTRFNMEYEFHPIKGARSWVQSCISWSGAPATASSLKLFENAGWLKGLRPRAISLSQFLEDMLKASVHFERKFRIITPGTAEERGSQLSLLFIGDGTMMHVFDGLQKRGIIGDERKPNVLRIAPTALYNTHTDVLVCVEAINTLLDELN